MRDGYRRLQLQLETAGTVTVLREIAEDLGYTIARGPYVGKGNVSELLNAFIRGDVSGSELEAALAKYQPVSVSVSKNQMPLPDTSGASEDDL